MPKQVAFDGGYASKANLAAAKALGVHEVVFHKKFGGDTAPALAFAVLVDGRIAVFDPGRRHFAVLGPDGEFERQVPLAGRLRSCFRGCRPAARPAPWC